MPKWAFQSAIVPAFLLATSCSNAAAGDYRCNRFTDSDKLTLASGGKATFETLHGREHEFRYEAKDGLVSFFKTEEEVAAQKAAAERQAAAPAATDSDPLTQWRREAESRRGGGQDPDAPVWRYEIRDENLVDIHNENRTCTRV